MWWEEERRLKGVWINLSSRVKRRGRLIVRLIVSNATGFDLLFIPFSLQASHPRIHLVSISYLRLSTKIHLSTSLDYLLAEASHPRNQLPWLITTWSICVSRWTILYLILPILLTSRPGWSCLLTSDHPWGSICVPRWTVSLAPPWNQLNLLPWRRYLQISSCYAV